MHKMILTIKPLGEKEIKIPVKNLVHAQDMLHDYLQENGPDVCFEVKGKAFILTEIKFEG